MTCHQFYSTRYINWIHAPKGLVVDTSEGTLLNASKGASVGPSEGAPFGASEGDVLRSGKKYDLQKKHCFTTSFADIDLEHLNTHVHFDTDLVFFVCNNSTTSHICNDVKKIVPGSLRQTNKSLTTANGTGAC